MISFIWSEPPVTTLPAPSGTVSVRIIDKFGGVRPMATALKKAPSAVFRWKRSGRIPAKHQGAVLKAAQELKLGIEPQDLIDMEASS
jgi:hypothetical protein